MRVYIADTLQTRGVNTQDKTHLEGVYFRPGVYEFVNTKQKLKYTTEETRTTLKIKLKKKLPKHTLISEKNLIACYRTYQEDKFKIIYKTHEEETYGFLMRTAFILCKS